MSERTASEALEALLPRDLASGLLAPLERLPDPAGAVRLLEELRAAGRLPAQPAALHAAITLAGASPYLADLMRADPEILDAVSSGPPRRLPGREELEEELARFEARASADPSQDVLRRFKQRETARIALADLLGAADLAAVTRALSILAEVVLEGAVRGARLLLEARHGRPTFRNERGDVEDSEFVVLGLGKLGGEELNYSSDVDLVYLFARDGLTTGVGPAGEGAIGNREFFTRLAAEVTRRAAGAPGHEVYRVDLNLRPGGRDGDLAISLGAAVAYYRSWAEGWERQALIKARPVAGARALGRRFLEAVEPLVYAHSPDPYLAVEIGAMKDRIDRQLSQQGASERDVKLGRGGIREIEFAVQALQMLRAGADRWLRQGNTLLALHRLVERGLLGYAEYAALGDAYAFLRHVEHRLQLGANRQTALLPDAAPAWRSLARSLWIAAAPRDDETRLLAEALERHRGAVRVFYDSVIGGAAQAGLGDAVPDVLLDRVDDAALLDRLRGLGVEEPEALLRPIRGLRRLLDPARLTPDLVAALRRAGPLLLRAAQEASSPPRALANLERLFSSLVSDPKALLATLADRTLLTPLVRLLGRGDLLAGLLIRQPEILNGLHDRARWLQDPGSGGYRALLVPAASGPAHDRAGELRRRHQAALATLAIRDISRQPTVRQVVKGLSDLADAAVEASLRLAEEGAGEAPRGGRMAILGLGRLGYREVDYGSDLDLLFVHEAAEHDAGRAHDRASRLASEVVRILSTLSRDGQLYRVDLRLRPSGNKGEIVVTPAGLLAYARGAADVWELQAFLKARPVAGDLDLGRRVLASVEEAILDRASLLDPSDLAAEVRGMRLRLERASCAAPEARRPKHGPGGLSDIDFIVEFLQLRHRIAAPPDKDTLALLALLGDAGWIDAPSRGALYSGYLFLRAVDHEMRLLAGGPVEALPADRSRLRELAESVRTIPGALDETGEDPAADLLAAFGRRTAAVRDAFDAILPPR